MGASRLPVPPLLVYLFLVGITWLVILLSEEESQPFVVDESERKALHRALDVVDAAASELKISSNLHPARLAKCDYEQDVDFAEEGILHSEMSDQESCCEACNSDPRCVASVLSSVGDEPPRACWMKYAASRRVHKAGVVACLPFRSQTIKEALPLPIEQRAKKTAKGELCEFRRDTDVAPGPGETMFEIESTQERCCAACVADPSCSIAVLSSLADDPSLACWLKPQTEPVVYKGGVVACVPEKRSAESVVAAKKILHSKPSSSGEYALSESSDAGLGAEELARRRRRIRDAVKHCWDGYKARAWGHDSVMPISGRGVSSGFNAAVTLVDSLDTLKLVGLDAEFNEGRDYVASDEFARKLQGLGGSTSIFETTIRILGGLLGAYTVSQDKIFVDRARMLGEKIRDRISDQGLVPPTFGASVRSGCMSLAHAGTTQLEMAYLAHLTGDASFLKAFKFYDTIKSKPNLDGLYPQCVGATSGKLTLGAEADSFYEYLLKLWLMRNPSAAAGARSDGEEKLDEWLWRAFDAAADGVDSKLATKSASGRLFLDDLNWRGGTSGGFSKISTMEHLSCFVGGWLALGSTHQADEARAKRHLSLADEIAHTCWSMYEAQPTRIGPERVKKHELDLSATDTREYILRPEAAETWWYMFRVRQDANPTESFDHYRDWGWKAFEAIDARLRVGFGHASLRDVRKAETSSKGDVLDRMESFWIAETLKYFYLLQDDKADGGLLPLDKYVFNTEAHPFTTITKSRR